MNHTPGPWTLQPPPIGGGAWFVWHEDQLIASVGSSEANGHLITAAPAMLAMLKRLHRWDSYIPSGGEVLRLIAEAEGR